MAPPPHHPYPPPPHSLLSPPPPSAFPTPYLAHERFIAKASSPGQILIHLLGGGGKGCGVLERCSARKGDGSGGGGGESWLDVWVGGWVGEKVGG